jgi:predicted DNA-binding transcriptional regulator YafY
MEEKGHTGLLVTLQARSEKDVLPWILSWGDQAKVLSPDFLGRKIRDHAENMMALYQKK